MTNNINEVYPHPRPKPPIQLWLLGFLAFSGLAALWLAAYHAFLNVASPVQAFFAATLIEAGLVIEALAVMKYRTWYTMLGLVISIIVSATYNYVQAEQIAGDILHYIPLVALALGPLSALVIVALTFGDTLQRYQNAASEWETNRAAWREERIAEHQRQEEEAEARKQADIDAERQRQWQLEDDERAYKRQQEEADRKQEELARKRAERAERKRNIAKPLPEASGSDTASNGSQAADVAELPEWLPVRPTSSAHFRQLAAEGKVNPNEITGPMLAPLINASERTARNWITAAKEEAATEKAVHANGTQPTPAAAESGEAS